MFNSINRWEMPVKITVITVTYNAASCLEPTIRSVLAQRGAEVEYLIIDGASTDGTQEIIRRYEASLAGWISEPDSGLYDAMNKGLQRATGEYVWFINAGDRIHGDDTVVAIAEALGDDRPGVVYGETDMIDVAGNRVAPRRLKAPRHLTWKSFRWGMGVSHQSFLARRDLAPPYDAENYPLTADFDWCIRCLRQSTLTLNMHRVLSDFMEAGISSQRRRESLRERYRIMVRYYGVLPTWLRHGWFAVRFGFARLFRGRV